MPERPRTDAPRTDAPRTDVPRTDVPRSDAPRRTWPPARRRPADDPDRPNWTAARNTARHLAEGWAIDAAEQRRLAESYRSHVLDLADELRALQRAAGLAEHDCPTCRRAASATVAGDAGTEGGTNR